MEASDAAEPIGQKIERLMKAKSLNQTQLADSSGIERTQLNRLIRGKRDPLAHEIPWLAEALGVTVETLLDGVVVPPSVRKAIDDVAAVAQRVITAERERDEAVARMKEMERAHSADRESWKLARRDLEARIALEIGNAEELRRRGHDALERSRADHERAYNQLAFATSELERENARLVSVEEWYCARVQKLEQELASSRAATVGVGGLALVLGLGIGGSK